jgi:hypothetical protein
MNQQSQSKSHISTDSQSVCLGVEPRLGLMTRYLLFIESYSPVRMGRPLWVEVGSVICNEPAVPAGCHTQPSEPIGDKNRITSSWSRKGQGRTSKGVAGREPRSTREKPCAWVLGVRWRMVEHGQWREAGTSGWRLRADECQGRVSALIRAVCMDLHVPAENPSLHSRGFLRSFREWVRGFHDLLRQKPSFLFMWLPCSSILGISLMMRSTYLDLTERTKGLLFILFVTAIGSFGCVWEPMGTSFHAGFFRRIFFKNEDGEHIFLRNVNRLSTDYKTLYPRR